MKKIASLLLLFLLLGSASAHSQDAATQEPAEQVTEEEAQQPLGEGELDNTPQYYDEPTRQKLSQLYWAISKLDPANDTDIDNFLLINECDIYREYAHNEFEWKEIREAARNFVTTNKKSFPLRFTFMQPIYLKDYSFERGGFEVNDEYKILGTRRFELFATDFGDFICGKKDNIEGYPQILFVELSRPFNLEFVKVDPDVASDYINAKSEDFRALPTNRQTEKRLYEMRDAYMVMNIKVYAYKGPERTRNGDDVAIVLGVLEGFEVYADRQKKTLMYGENFRRRKRVSKMEQDLIESYKAKNTGKPPIDLPSEGMLLGD